MADAGLVLLISAALAGRSLALVLASGTLVTGLLAAAAFRFPWARTFGLIPWALALLILGAALASPAAVGRRVVLGASALALLEGAIAGLLVAAVTLRVVSAGEREIASSTAALRDGDARGAAMRLSSSRWASRLRAT
jgi:Cu-processing system permease protein